MPATTSSPSGRPSVSTASSLRDSGTLDAVDLEATGKSPGAVGRQAGLADSLARLRKRTKVVATERWLLVAGSIMVPLGGILVLLGWFGASHTGRLFEQIPYMISGGLLGLGLVIAGGFCYFGFWLARLVSDQRQQSGQLLVALERIEGLLAKSSNGHAPAGAVAPPKGRPEFVATVKGTLYHRPDCQIVADRDAKDLRAVRAGARGRTPCRICLPEEASDDPAEREPASPEATDPTPHD